MAHRLLWRLIVTHLARLFDGDAYRQAVDRAPEGLTLAERVSHAPSRVVRRDGG